ncbi:MAG: hypothetical protein KAS22_06990 [Candidatus Heimdallarchaeota archaeon]|nr:hypothetical protein [Candidatus Heimdallarchaeota archaeon]
MTVPIEKFKDRRTLIVLFCIVILGNIMILSIPCSWRNFDVGGESMIENIWIFGAWNQYNRLDPDSANADSGTFRDLPNYSVVIFIFIIISTVFLFCSAFFLGKNRWRNNTLQRIAGIIFSAAAIVGLASVLMFRSFYRLTYFPDMDFYLAYYVGLVYFPIAFIGGLRSLFFPSQLPQPVITPGPEQEGILMDEEKKDKKRRKLFKQIDYIEEVAKDDY